MILNDHYVAKQSGEGGAVPKQPSYACSERSSYGDEFLGRELHHTPDRVRKDSFAFPMPRLSETPDPGWGNDMPA